MDEENEYLSSKLRISKLYSFTRNGFWDNIGCMISIPTFSVGDKILWDKEDKINITGKENKGTNIRGYVGLYDVFAYSPSPFLILF